MTGKGNKAMDGARKNQAAEVPGDLRAMLTMTMPLQNYVRALGTLQNLDIHYKAFRIFLYFK